ncbi:MAG: radical SAM protein [Pseudomonadales bacterium]|jgi:MoaA/NifB/PqqE/SkfB family radical SAM enzyme|nr:radical SAM protein [Pseudomonadales bacterium]MCP5319578.1 radical SAM protein [Pseudomonadales bacterium]MCP5337493.1 radical SAM protein [Pseudomonadales bacterium]
MGSYRVTVNLELTAKCNALCVMCPRETVASPRPMQLDVLQRVVERLEPQDVYRVVIAGYGEPTTHPRWRDCIEILRGARVRLDMVSNGHLLDEERLLALDGLLHMLVISFSSVDPEVYQSVHVNLDHQRVMRNIELAQARLQHTRLAISLTPLTACLASLEQTIAWLRGRGVTLLTMSPTLYDRAGAMHEEADPGLQLRQIIAKYGLRSQEFDFIPSLHDVFGQWRCNRFRCLPRNTVLPVAADGSYQYCFNDVAHAHPIGHVAQMSVREALQRRERMPELVDLCEGCNVRGRYGLLETLRVAGGYLRHALKQ